MNYNKKDVISLKRNYRIVIKTFPNLYNNEYTKGEKKAVIEWRPDKTPTEFLNTSEFVEGYYTQWEVLNETWEQMKLQEEFENDQN